MWLRANFPLWGAEVPWCVFSFSVFCESTCIWELSQHALSLVRVGLLWRLGQVEPKGVGQKASATLIEH